MAEETNGANNSTRLDRIERIVEVLASTTADLVSVTGELQQDVKILLKAQVVMGEQMREGFAKLTAAQQHTEESLNALIAVVDDIVRRPGSGSSKQG